MEPTRVLFIEDDKGQADLISKILAKTGNDFEINWVPRLVTGLERLSKGEIDLVILDLGLPDSQGLDTFIQIYQKYPEIPVVVLTGLADEKLGLAAIRLGAQDYLIKGSVNLNLLDRTIRYAMERRRFQEILLAERRRLYTVLDTLPAIIYLWTPNYKIKFANRNFRETFGSPQNRHCYEIIHDRKNPCEICMASKVIQDQNSRLNEITHGNGKIYQISYHPFNELDGSPLILVMETDITKRKEAEEALRAEEQFLDDIFNSIQDGLMVLDRDRTIIRVNPAMNKFPHMEPVVGRKCFEVYPFKSEPCETCPVRTTLEKSEAGFNLVEARDADGGKKISEVYVYPLINHATGQTQGVIEYVRDVTENQRIKEALQDSEEKLRFLATKLLSAQEDERKRLSQGLHDELGHALLAMKLDLGAMGKQLLPEQTELAENLKELMSYFDEVVEGVRRLYLDLTPGDLEDLGLTAALQSLCEEFGRQHEKIVWSVHLDNIDRFFPIRVQITFYRMFQEILTNIGKHADPSHVEVTAQNQEGHVRFEVKDNGRGFDTGNGWRSSAKAGMGLLALEERIRLLGGSLKIWSQKNKGTTITFTVPKENIKDQEQRKFGLVA